jgi:hypothetical protein
VVFLVFTAVRVHTVVRALRTRRSPSPAASADGAAVDAAARAGAGPSRGPGTPEKDHNAWGQAVAAVAVFGALGAALWVAPHVMRPCPQPTES